MKNAAFEPVQLNVKSYELSHAIVKTDLFSKVELKPVSRLIIVTLASMYNPRLGYSFPGIEKLATCTGYSDRQIKEGLKDLSIMGLIVRTDKKIYFTKKFYELLDLKIFCNENEKSSSKNEVSASKSEVSSPPIHEQENKQIKKQFVKNSFFETEVNQVKKLLEKDSYLSNKMQAEIVLNGFHKHNTKEQDYKAILQIKEMWNLKTENFDILRYFEQRKQSDMIFKRKIENLEYELSGIFKANSGLINQIRQAWS